MVGVLRSDSVKALWAMPPMRLANQRVTCSAAGMKVGFGRSRVLLGLQADAAAEQLALRLQVHRRVDGLHHQQDHRPPRPLEGDHPAQRLQRDGAAIAASHFSGRVSFVPAPVIVVKVPFIASPAWP